MENDVSFLYYDSISESWQHATKEQLAVINDPSVYVIPIDEDGTQGKRITWGEYESPEQKKAKEHIIRQAAIKEEQRRKAEEEEQAKIKAEREKEEQERLKKEQAAREKEEECKRKEEEKRKKEFDCQQRQATNLQAILDKLNSSKIELTCELVRKLCRLAYVVFWLNLYAGGIIIGLLSSPDKPAVGLFMGFLASIVVSLIICGLVSMEADREHDKKGQ